LKQSLRSGQADVAWRLSVDAACTARSLGEAAIGSASMQILNLQNPVFVAYVMAASIMILKGICMSWLTVLRMTRERAGFRSPEDILQTKLNPHPHPAQLEPNERVERIRRIQQNDLENIPYFLIAGLLYCFSGPSPVVAIGLFVAYVVTRLAHFAAYLTAQTHDVRAALWTPGSLILAYFAAASLLTSAKAAGVLQ
jgi:glutathione S-transferase